MPILTITVDSPNDLLNASYLGAGAKIRVERSAVGGGAGYIEIGTTALVADENVYAYYDLGGAIDAWYRVRFSKSDGSSPSSYGTEFQAGDDTAGFLCSVEDIALRVNGGSDFGDDDKLTVLELIRDVTTEIEQYCGRWFVPRPLAGTTTILRHTRAGHRLRFPKGISALTSLSIATSGQPASGGAYALVPAANWYLEPAETVGWPSTVVVLRPETGARFYDASFGAQMIGAFGWTTVAANIRGIAIEAITRRWIGKETASPAAVIGPNGSAIILRDISPGSAKILERHRDISGLVGRSQ